MFELTMMTVNGETLIYDYLTRQQIDTIVHDYNITVNLLVVTIYNHATGARAVECIL